MADIFARAMANKNASALVDKANVVTPEKYGAKGDGITDDTLAIQSAISYCEGLGGGNVKLAGKEYLVSQLKLSFKTRLYGEGVGATIIKQVANSNIDCIVFSVNSIGCSITDISVVSQSSTGSGNGIVSLAYTGSTTLYSNVNKSKSFKIADLNATSGSSFRCSEIKNVFVTGFPNYGIYINAWSFVFYLDNVYSYNNGVGGIYNSSTDNFFTRVYADYNGGYGIFEHGSNNKWTNCKSIWNGRTNETTSALKTDGYRNHFVNFETQDNYANGFEIDGNYNTLISCLTNYDGNDVNTSSQSIDKHGFIINGSYNMFKSCLVALYNPAQTAFIKKPVNIGSSAFGNDIDIKTQDKSSKKNRDYQYHESVRKNDFLFCDRSSSVTVNGTTFNAGVPVVTTNGLIPQSDVETLSFRGLDIHGSHMTFITDFTFNLDVTSMADGSYTIKAWESNTRNIRLEITVTVATGAITSTYLQFSDAFIQGNSSNPVSYSYIGLTYLLKYGQSYRLFCSVDINDGVSYISYAKISNYDVNGVIGSTSDSRIVTLSGTGFRLYPVKNFTFPMISGGSIKGNITFKKIIVTTKYIPDMYGIIGEDIQEYVRDAELYADFTKYIGKPTYDNLDFATLPPASDYYRGKKVFVPSASGDKEYICLYNGTIYQWVATT